MLFVKRSQLRCITGSVHATSAGFASQTGVLQNLSAFLFIGGRPVAWHNDSLNHTIPGSRTLFNQWASPESLFRLGRLGIGG